MPSELSRRQQLLTMTAVYAVLFLLGLETTIGGSLLPQASKALNGFNLFPWTGTLQALASACTTPIAARLGDIWGRKRLLQWAIGLLCLAGLGSGLAGSMEQLLLMRLLNGVALGMMAATAFALPADVFSDPGQRVRWQSLGGVMFAIASCLGPPLGATLAEGFGWRTALFVVPAVSVLVQLVLARVPAMLPVHLNAQRLDVAGAMLLCLFVSTSLLALNGSFGERGNASLGSVCFVLCVVAFGALWKHQRRVQQPVLSLDVLRVQAARLITLSTLASGAILFLLLFYGPTMLHALAGLDMTKAGATMVPLLVGMPAGSVINGMLFRRLRHPQHLMAVGSSLLAAGCGLLVPLNESSPQIMTLVGFAFCGVGLGFINQNQTLFIQMVAPPQHLGAATGLISTARTYGGAIGSALVGLAAGIVGMHQALVSSLWLALVAAAFLLATSLRIKLP